MKNIITLILFVFITLPAISQQQISLVTTFNKYDKCLKFTFKNNNKKLEACIRHAQFNEGPGSYFGLTAYDKNNNKIGYYRYMYHPTELSLIFLPEEVKETKINLISLQSDISTANEGIIDKIQIHCVVHYSIYGKNAKRYLERFEKDYTFNWK